MRATISATVYTALIPAAALVLIAVGMTPVAATATAIGSLTILAVAGFAVLRWTSPQGPLIAAVARIVEVYAICATLATVIGLSTWLAGMLHFPADWADFIGGLLAIPALVVVLRFAVPHPRAATTRPDPGPPRTDHPVTIAEGPHDSYLVALCDADDCGWMEFAHPGDRAAQEKELRAVAARHTTFPVPGIKWRETR